MLGMSFDYARDQGYDMAEYSRAEVSAFVDAVGGVRLEVVC